MAACFLLAPGLVQCGYTLWCLYSVSPCFASISMVRLINSHRSQITGEYSIFEYG
ncbi:hypothetical protein CY34DRAFT_811147 [Suillus luteus UH-Slu-Lm8-n1]|uniref:Uncharacterized protein n=1 Tax=Suillus luteus UH-Slu-Lm8-n1 TaxID=930992 RepID=A0A0D0A4R8_9AGAM|nr:hypothetical protein CY34DRAFT_811147 [Suillus luteus UH-Slu-Lm8-n1]